MRLGLIAGCRRRSTLGSPAGLSAPTLRIVSALGTVPLTLGFDDADYIAGDYGQLEVASDSGFTTITQKVFSIDGASWALSDEAIGLATPAGPYWARIRIARDNDSGSTTVAGTDPLDNAISFPADVSAWSNVVNDTINASVAALNTVNGVNKNSTLTVTGTPALSFSGLNGNDKTSVRTTVEQASSKAQFELTINSGATTDFAVGIDNGTADLSGLISPGYNDSTGINVEFSSGSGVTVNWNARVNQVFVISAAGTTQNGDIMAIVYDDAAHTLEVWRTRAGTTVQLGATVTGLPTLSHRFGFASTINSTMAGTLNFGGSTYAKTPGTGVATIWA